MPPKEEQHKIGNYMGGRQKNKNKKTKTKKQKQKNKTKIKTRFCAPVGFLQPPPPTVSHLGIYTSKQSWKLLA